MSVLRRAAASAGVLAVLALALAVWAPSPAAPPAAASPAPSGGAQHATTTGLACAGAVGAGEAPAGTATGTVTTLTCTTVPAATPTPAWSCGDGGASASAEVGGAGWFLEAEAILVVCDGDSVVAVVEFHGLAALDYGAGAVKYELHARVIPVEPDAGSLGVRRSPVGFSVLTESGAWIVVAEPGGEWVPVGDGYDVESSGVAEAPSAAGAPVEVAVWAEVNVSGVVVVVREDASVAPAAPPEPPAPGARVEVVVNLTSKEGVAVALPAWLDSITLNPRPAGYVAAAVLALSSDGTLRYEAALTEDGREAYEAAAEVLAGALDWLSSAGAVAGIDSGDSKAIADLLAHALAEGATYIHIYWNGTAWDAATAAIVSPAPMPPGTPTPTYTYTSPSSPTATSGQQTIQTIIAAKTTATGEPGATPTSAAPVVPSQPGQEAEAAEAGAGTALHVQAGTAAAAAAVALAAAALAYLLARRL